MFDLQSRLHWQSQELSGEWRWVQVPPAAVYAASTSTPGNTVVYLGDIVAATFDEADQIASNMLTSPAADTDYFYFADVEEAPGASRRRLDTLSFITPAGEVPNYLWRPSGDVAAWARAHGGLQVPGDKLGNVYQFAHLGSTAPIQDFKVQGLITSFTRNDDGTVTAHRVSGDLTIPAGEPVEILSNVAYDALDPPDPDTLYVLPELGGYFIGEYAGPGTDPGTVYRINELDPDDDAHGFGEFGTGHFVSPCLATRGDGRLYITHRSSGNHRLRVSNWLEPFTGGTQVGNATDGHLSDVINTSEEIADITFLDDELFVLTIAGGGTQNLYRINPDDPSDSSGDFGLVGSIGSSIENPKCLLSYDGTLYLIAERDANENAQLHTLNPDSTSGGVVSHSLVGTCPDGLWQPIVATYARGETDHAYVVQYAPPQRPQLWRMSLGVPSSTVGRNGRIGDLPATRRVTGIAYSPHIPSLYLGEVLLTQGSDQTSDTGTEGLDQAQVDGRVDALVEEYALKAETATIPYNRVFSETPGS